jgi:hypothetical protein
LIEIGRRQTVISTFNPVTQRVIAAATSSRLGIAGRLVAAVLACPARRQCTAVNTTSGAAITFDPLRPGHVSRFGVYDHGIAQMTCASTDECIAVDEGGNEVTFNPLSHARPHPVHLVQGELAGVACVSARLCVTGEGTNGRGYRSGSILDQEVSFDPMNASAATPTSFLATSVADSFDGVACPTVTECLGVSLGFVEQISATITGYEGAFAFNPAAPATQPLSDFFSTGPAGNNVVTSGQIALSCPSASQCTSIDGAGHALTFDPANLSHAEVELVAPEGNLIALACASVHQCTTLQARYQVYADVPHFLGTRVLTFDPTHPGTPAVL